NKNFAGMNFSGKDENDMKNVEFLGRVTDDELVSIYQKALAFVFPSFYEGFGIPPLESQACGCAVVSSIQSFLPDVLAEGAMNFFGKDENDMKNVEFLGRVTDDELVSIYQKALAFVFPSFYEGFGIPPLEAQACGCPVVSSNQASLPEVLADSAMYFDPYNNQ